MELTATNIIFLCFMFAIGAILGSFACCQAWRLRYRQEHKKSPGKRSVCLSCGHKLSATENIPILSWLILRGKCKKCGKKIGFAEILSEISLGTTFLTLGFSIWPEILVLREFSLSALIYFSLLLILAICLVLMWILMIYDAKWGELPTALLVVLDILAVVYLLLKVTHIAVSGNISVDLYPLIHNTLLSAVLLSGIYFLLYRISGERLVGGGDWILALGIAILIGHWWLAIIVLFLSNLAASIYGLIKKKTTGKSVIHFGPFLVSAFAIVFLFQSFFMNLLSL